jgi:DNA-directed RNA polymerase subunit RPC12/RpoP
MAEEHEEWRCPVCGSGSEEHTVERDGPESLDIIVCRRCGNRWYPRPPAPSTKSA